LTIARRTIAISEWASRRRNVRQRARCAATSPPMRCRRYARASQPLRYCSSAIPSSTRPARCSTPRARAAGPSARLRGPTRHWASPSSCRRRAAFAQGTGMQVLSAQGSELEHQLPVRRRPAALRSPGSTRPRTRSASCSPRATAALTDELFHPDRRAGDRGGAHSIRTRNVFALMHGLYWLTANLADADASAHRRGRLLTGWTARRWRFLHYLAQRSPVCPWPSRSPGEPDEGREQASLLDALATHPAPPSAGCARSPRPRPSGSCGRPSPTRAKRFSRVCAEGHQRQPSVPEGSCSARRRGPRNRADRRRRRTRPGARPGVGLEDRPAPTLPARVRYDGVGPRGRVQVWVTAPPLSLVAQLAGLKPAVADDAADALAGADVLVAGEPVAFVHPIVRAAVYAELPRSERSSAHAEAARLLQRRRRTRRTASRAICSRRIWRRRLGWSRALRSDAARALARGAPESAIRLLRRALGRCRPHRRSTPRLLLELGHADAVAGNPRAGRALRGGAGGPPRPRPSGGGTARARPHASRARRPQRRRPATFERGLNELGDRNDRDGAANGGRLCRRPLARRLALRPLAKCARAANPGARVSRP